MIIPYLAGTDIHTPVLMPSDEELATLGNQLWGRDVNRGTRSDVILDITGDRYIYIHTHI